jgi:hypothetical protein
MRFAAESPAEVEYKLFVSVDRSYWGFVKQRKGRKHPNVCKLTCYVLNVRTHR